MQYEQVKLPLDADGTNNNHCAPSMAGIQAFGYMDSKHYIEYTITGSDTGQSDESGENLTKYFVRKVEELHGDNGFDIWWKRETDIKLYVNAKGEAYRTWKGKLKGRPVCNFNSGFVYKYVRGGHK